MKTTFYTLLVLMFSLPITVLLGQKTPVFDTFKGDVYKLPFNKFRDSYGKHVYQYDKIGSVEWNEINISDRHIDDGFPDIEAKKLFGIVLKSTVTIKEKACYEFILNSDDGTKFWIHDQLVLDNGGEHVMTEKRDTIVLKAGTYPVKLWYNQLYPDRFGFIFKANNVGQTCPMAKELIETKAPKLAKTPIKKLNFESKILFHTNEYKIKKEATSYLNKLCANIKEMNPKKMLIVGHTDDVGDFDYNLDLSLKRAEALKKYLMDNLNLVDVEFISKGMGERFPIAPNDTEEGRMQNRRVEIIVN